MKRIKENRISFICSLIVILIPVFVGIGVWNKLPDPIATHFGIDGVPNGWTSKAGAVFGIPAALLAMQVFVVLITAIDNKEKKKITDKVFCMLMWIIPFASIFGTVLMYGYELGHGINVNFMGFVFIGILMLVIGNYLPKVRRNNLLGLRIKWTLESDRNWEYSQRITAWFMVVIGFVMIIMAFISITASVNGIICYSIIFGGIAIIVILPCILSYRYMKKHCSVEGYYAEKI